MATTTSNLPKGSLILVTGANGFVASHVVDRLLEDGFNVRGSVRSEAKGKWLHQVFGSKYGKGRFETIIVPDMQANGAFDAAVKGVAGICHTASIMTFVDKPEEVIPTVVSYAHKGSMEKESSTDIHEGQRSFKHRHCRAQGAQRQVPGLHIQQHRSTAPSAKQAHRGHERDLERRLRQRCEGSKAK
jgi:hypothetical protein